MLLYHGTAERHIPKILKEGIKPRGKKSGNWKHSIESNADAVYLTNAYPLHFAGNAVNEKERLAVIEVNTRELFILNLVPDEDYMEQASRREGPAPTDKSMSYRTRWYRKRARNYQHFWIKSIDGMGTCCHMGVIPVSALTRVAYVDRKTYGKMIMHGCDPIISTINYRLCGAKYRNYTHWLFGDPLEENPRHPLDDIPSPPMRLLDRSGVTVQTLPELVTGGK